MTGSSTVAPSLGKKALTSSASPACSGSGPTTPTSRSIGPGRSASTASALSSRTATQPGPLSTHCASTMSSRSTARIAPRWVTKASSTGPERTSGGAAKARPPSVRRTRTSPASHSCTTGSSPAPRRRRLQPRVAGAECRIPGERQLGYRREDSHSIVGFGGSGLEYECGLGKVRPTCKALHFLGGEAVSVQNHRHRIAGERSTREDVNLRERSSHFSERRARRMPWRRG